MLVVLSIAVGIFATGAILGAREVLLREFERDFSDSARASITLNTTDVEGSVVRLIDSRDDVIAAEGRRMVRGRIQTNDPGEPVINWSTLELNALTTFDLKVHRIEPLDTASWPPRKGEVLIESAARAVYDYEIGDTVYVETANGEAQLRVAGFVHDLNSIPTRFFNQVTAYVSTETLALLDEPTESNTLYINVDPELGRLGAGNIAAEIRDNVLEPRGVRVVSMNVPEIGFHFFGDIFKAVSVLLLAMALMALFSSGFLVVTTISAIVVQQIRQLGIMKSIGAQRWQLARLYYGLVLGYGVIAMAIGLPLGLLAGRWFTWYAADVLNFLVLDYSYPTWVISVLVLIGLVLPIAAASAPIISGVRRPIVQALNPNATLPDFGHSLIDRALGKIRGLSRPVALALRSTFSHKSRLALTLITLAFASGVVMSVFSARASLIQTTEDVASWWNYDAMVTLATPVPQKTIESEAAKVPGVTHVETWMDGRASITRSDGTSNENFWTVGYPADTKLLDFEFTLGRSFEPGEKGVILNTELFNDEPSLVPGSTVTLSIGGEEVERTVIGIATGSLQGQTLFMERDDLAALSGVEGAATRAVVAIEGGEATERDEEVLDQRQRTVADALEDHFDNRGVVTSQTFTGVAQVEETRSQLGILIQFLIILASALALVGIISLTGSMTLSVIESTREIGVMRSIGASHASIFKIYITQGIVIGTIAWAFGAILSWPLSWALMNALQLALGMPLAYKFSWGGVFLWLALVWVISALGSLLPSWRASAVSIREAISYE